MKTETISLQRRHLMIAGAVAAVTPGVLLAAAPLTGAQPATARGTSLVASGRVTTADGKPLAGAAVLAWHVCAPGTGNADACQATTDADGRFVFSAAAPYHSANGIQPMHVRVTHPAIAAHHAEVRFERGRDMGDTVHAQTLFDRDTLRASFSLTVG